VTEAERVDQPGRGIEPLQIWVVVERTVSVGKIGELLLGTAPSAGWGGCSWQD
jgi:hypothetical protein